MHGSTGRIFYVCNSANIKCCFEVDNNTGDQPDSAAAAWSQQLTELAASVTTLQSQYREAAGLQHSIMQQQAQHGRQTSELSVELDSLVAILAHLAAAAPTPEACWVLYYKVCWHKVSWHTYSSCAAVMCLSIRPATLFANSHVHWLH